MKTIKFLLILCILLNILLVFCNLFNPTWAIQQIDLWLEPTNSKDRLINQETMQNVNPVTINGEVHAVVEVAKKKGD